MKVKNSKSVKPATKSAKQVNLPEFLAIGTKGVVNCLVAPEAEDDEPVEAQWPRFSALGLKPIEITAAHLAGKPAGVPHHDLGRFVSERTEKSRVVSVFHALKQKLVQKVTLALSDGRKLKAYAHGQFKLAQKANTANHGQYFATPELPAGRVETRRVFENDGSGCRNAGLCVRVSAVTAGW